LIIVLIFLIPYFFFRRKNQATIISSEKVNSTSETAISSEKLFDDINFTNLNNYSEKNKNKQIILLQNNLFAIGENYIFDIKNQKQINIPQNTTTIISATAMDDLNLILLFTQDKKIISFTPISKKFQENNIELPLESNLKIAGTYLTYLYFIDQTSNKIYRYPRAEGGFGKKISWLKEAVSLSNVSNTAINENIFILKENKIIKLFKGLKENFNMNNIKDPSFIFSQEDYQNLYILDKSNKKIIITNNDGTLLKEMVNKKFSQTKEIQVNEKEKTIFLLQDSGEIVKFEFTL
jgi:hypothetical protein